MPAKKQKPQQKSDDSRPDEKLLAFAEALTQYYDYKDTDFTNLLKTLPENFPLKIGNSVVGAAYVNWRLVLSKIFSMSARASKPPDRTDEEHADMVMRLWDAASPEAREAVSEPFLLMLYYIFRFTPATLSETLRHLCSEAFYESIYRKLEKANRKTSPSPRKFVEKILKQERAAMLARLPKLKREGTKTKAQWRDNATLIKYAGVVGSRKLLVQTIKKTYDDSGGAEGWTEDLQDSPDFRLLKTGISQSLLNKIIRRVANTGLSKREREPIAIACEMARVELDLPVQKPPTLRTYYAKGLALTKTQRRSP